MRIGNTLAAMALGAVLGACFVEGNRSAREMIAQSKCAVKEKVEEMKHKNDSQPETETESF